MSQDEYLGLDFESTIWPEQVGLCSSSSHRSSPSGDHFLSAVLTDLQIVPGDRVLDIGCGKGSAMRVMLNFPFSLVAGVEISEHIVNIAKNNFKIMGVTDRCEVYLKSAEFFQHYDHFNYFYMYNPFPAYVMQRVVGKLTVSPSTTIIYNNPTCHDVIVGYGWKKVKEFPDKWGNGIYIYRG